MTAIIDAIYYLLLLLGIAAFLGWAVAVYQQDCRNKRKNDNGYVDDFGERTHRNTPNRLTVT